MTDKKQKLTPEEKKKKLKEDLQGWLFAILFVLIFIAAFAIYGMQSPLFGGN